MQFHQYLTAGTPFAPDSFLVQGEWFKFKNIGDYFHDEGFGQQEIIDDLECQVSDYENTIEEQEKEKKAFEKFQHKAHLKYVQLHEEMENFDVIELLEDCSELDREDLISIIDKRHQKWFNILQEIGQSIADIVDQPEEKPTEKK